MEFFEFKDYREKRNDTKKNKQKVYWHVNSIGIQKYFQ